MSKPERDGGKVPLQFFPPLLESLARRHALKQSELRDPLPPKERRWKTTMSQWRRSRWIFDPNREANKPNRFGSASFQLANQNDASWKLALHFSAPYEESPETPHS